MSYAGSSLTAGVRRFWPLAPLGAAVLLYLLLIPPGHERLPPLSIYSAEPSGGRALWLWLRELGYPVESLEASPYRVPEGADVLMILAPLKRPSDQVVGEVERFVKAGGTLVLAGDGFQADPLFERFGLDLRSAPQSTMVAGQAEASLDPAIDVVEVQATGEILLGSSGAAPFLEAEGRVFGAHLRFGSGQVLALSSPHALSNEALRREGNARLARWLVGSERDTRILFDEVHHGFEDQQRRSFWALLLEVAWGRAALLAGLAVLLYLLLAGRRFGRPRPARVSRGRSLEEHVVSLAGLYRAGGKRAFVANHFCSRLKRALALGLGLPGDAPLEQAEARARSTGRDVAPALKVLRALGRERPPPDGELVGLVGEGEAAVLRAIRRPGTRGDDSGS